MFVACIVTNGAVSSVLGFGKAPRPYLRGHDDRDEDVIRGFGFARHVQGLNPRTKGARDFVP